MTKAGGGARQCVAVGRQGWDERRQDGKAQGHRNRSGRRTSAARRPATHAALHRPVRRQVLLVAAVLRLAGGVLHGPLGHGHRHERPARGGGGEHHGHDGQRAAAQGVTHRSRWHLDGAVIYNELLRIETGGATDP